MEHPFTDQELDRMALDVERQLRVLHEPPLSISRSGAPATGPNPHLKEIERVTGEPARSFLAKFKRAARKDICEPGGILNAQWVKFRDIAAKDALRTVGPILATFGLTAAPLQTVAVAVTVYLLHLGADAFCREE